MICNLREFIFNHAKFIMWLLRICNFFNFNNRIKGSRGNCINMKCVYLKGLKILIEGKNNTIEVDDFTRILNSCIYIHGNNNRIIIGPRCYLNEMDIYIEDDHGSITLGKHTSIDGKTHFAVIEGTTIEVGNDCMFSSDIQVRTGDAHSILDFNGNRINKSRDIKIGNHCWIGLRSIILKGSCIGDNSIIGAGAIVTNCFEEANCIIVGIPAKITRKNINWNRVRV